MPDSDAHVQCLKLEFYPDNYRIIAELPVCLNIRCYKEFNINLILLKPFEGIY